MPASYLTDPHLPAPEAEERGTAGISAHKDSNDLPLTPPKSPTSETGAFQSLKSSDEEEDENDHITSGEEEASEIRPPQHATLQAALPEESYPTPIISNRGFLHTPPSFLLPLQLPAAAASTDKESAAVARFSSLNEPPIQCNWPATPVNVPPEISIPTAASSVGAHGNNPSASISLISHLPAVTGYGSLVRLLWKMCRMASLGNLPSHPWPLLLNDKVLQSPSTGTSTAKMRTLLSTPTPQGDGAVHGLPSFGQTCFMNATLQALASLEAFEVYLQHIVYLVEQKRVLPLHLTTNPWSPTTHQNPPSQDVARILYNCLQSVNGVVAVLGVIDTRPLLREIAVRHQQFRAMGLEQQDAQEFLTALLDTIVSEGEITSASFVYPNSFVGLPEPVSTLSLLWEDEENDTLTVVSGYKERLLKSNLVESSSTSGNDYETPTKDPSDKSMPPSDSFDFSAAQTPPMSNQSAKASLSTSTATTTTDDAPSGRHFHNGVLVRPEEKKQEEFEIHIPKVASEEELLSCMRPPPVHHVMGKPHIGKVLDDPSLSTVSSKDRLLPTSLEIMRTTTTALSPSPLTGWMGSSLQCRQCGHVRPIRNAPFGDWSVTPTAVSNGWLQRGEKVHHARPCRLEECLADYVRVERVDDVECRSCTLKRARADMLDEIQMTEGVIEGLLAKAKRQGKATSVTDDSQFSALRKELHGYRCELLRLQRVDTDDDQQSIFLQDKTENVETPRLHRASARKCMFLTRLPAILCIHVQRNFFDPVNDRMTKVTQPVVFPEILDLAPYCAYGGVLGGCWAGSQRKSTTTGSNKAIPYRLQAVMEHRGSAFSGHYVCFRRDKTNGGWLFISDHLVRSVSWGEVQRCQAYMLFYEAM